MSDSPSTDAEDAATLRLVLADVERAWREGHTERLRECFHPRMQIVGPDQRVYADGIDACVESYREFAANARVLDYVATTPVVRIWEDAAVCTYSWTMRWERDGAVQADRGSDQFVFVRRDGRWLAAHRMLQIGVHS
jgi:hypothetical protein